jgi:asparagine synthase (glutamine-hydrolysing)
MCLRGLRRRRSPEHDVADCCARLPYGYKYRRGVRKFLLHQAVADLVPEVVRQRANKGFGIPLTRWLRQAPPPLPLDAVSGLQPAWIAERWSAARSGQIDELLLWSWLSLQGIIGQNRKRSTNLAA